MRSAAPDGRLLPRRGLVAIAIVVAALVIPALVVVLARDDRSIGDIALIELRTRDVFSRHPPVTGVYSRYGWSHPGPLMYHVYALPYRVFGGNSDALRITALVVNLGVLIALAWLVSRRGKAATVAMLGAAVALVWGMLPRSLSDGWNVTIAVLPLMLSIVACWCALCGDRFGLPIASIAAVFVFQAHVGFGVVIAPVFVATLIWKLVSAVRSDDRAERRRVLLVVCGCVVLFGPPVFDMIVDWPGNLGRLVKWSVTRDEASLGMADAARVIGRTSSLSFPFHQRFPGNFLLSIDSVTTGVAPGVLLVTLAGAALLASRRRWRDEGLLCVVVGSTWLTGFVAASTVTRPLAPWLIEWLQPLGWLTYAAVALVGWRLVQSVWGGHAPRRVPELVLGLAASVALIVGTVAFARSEADAGYLSDHSAHAIDALTDAAGAESESAPMFIQYSGDPLDAGTMLNAVVNGLDARGHEVCVPTELAYQFGNLRNCGPQAEVHLILRSEPSATEPPAGATIVRVVDPLTPAQREEADGLTDQLSQILEANGMTPQIPLLRSPLVDLVLAADPPHDLIAVSDDVRRLHELRQIPGARYGLYRVS